MAKNADGKTSFSPGSTHARLPSGGGENEVLRKTSDDNYEYTWGRPALSERLDYTVGPGEDFETLNDAFKFIEESNFNVNSVTSVGSDGEPSGGVIVLNLTEGTHTAFSPDNSSENPFNVVSVFDFQGEIEIRGTGTATTLVGGPIGPEGLGGLYFGNIRGVTLRDLNFSGVLLFENVASVNLGIYEGEDSLSLSNVIIVAARTNIYVYQEDLDIGILTLTNASQLSSGVDLAIKLTGFSLFPSALSLEQGSVANVANLTLNPGIVDGTNPVLTSSSNSSFYSSGNVTMEGGTSGPAVEVAYSGKLTIEGSFVQGTGYGYASMTSSPLNEVQYDGSFISDSSTGLSFKA